MASQNVFKIQVEQFLKTQPTTNYCSHTLVQTGQCMGKNKNFQIFEDTTLHQYSEKQNFI